MLYEFEIKDIEPIRVATMSYKGLATKAGKYFQNVFKSIKGKANGSPFFCYYDMNQETGIAKMDLCVPTAEMTSGQGITIRELPSVKSLCLTHTGSYDKLPMAYEAIYRYIHENNLAISPPWREIFIKGPGMFLKGNPNKYITEIAFPLIEGDHYDSNRH